MTDLRLAGQRQAIQERVLHDVEVNG